MNISPIKQFPFTSILGWSVSRYDVFNKCKRQYFYSYYGKFDKEISQAKIQKLKLLTSSALEIGNIVHDGIRDLLIRLQKTTKPISRSRFLQYLKNMTENYCNSKIFSEVYYKQQESIAVEDIFLQVSKILENFLTSKRLKWIFEIATLESKNWIIEPSGFGETRIKNYKAYCKVDFLIPVKDKIYILDWKTGKQDLPKHSRQLIGYSLWASYHFNTNAKNINSTVVYLYPNYTEYTVALTDENLAKFYQQVETETKQMYEYLIDIENNIPKEKDCFEKTDNEFFCKYCNFRELCKNV